MHAHAITAPFSLCPGAYFSLLTLLVLVGAFLSIAADEETGLERANLPAKPPYWLAWNNLEGCRLLDQCPPGELCSMGFPWRQPNIAMLPKYYTLS